MTRKSPILYYDPNFKSFFLENEDLFLILISDITNIDILKKKEDIEIIYNDIPISRGNEKFNRTDFIIKVSDNFFINVELNKDGSNDWKNKSISYIFKIYSIHTKSGKNYLETKTYQVNINCFESDDDPVIGYSLSPTIIWDGYSSIRKVNNNLPNFTECIYVYTFNVYKANKMYYNEYKEKGRKDIPNYIRWGAFLSLKNFSKTSEVMEGIFDESRCKRAMKKLDELQNKSDYLTTEEVQEMYETSYERGLVAAEQKGITQTTSNIIKSMLENNMDYEIISKVTGKSLEEIEEIENSIEL